MASLNTKTFVVGYVPVIHYGYIELFKRYPDATIALFDQSIINESDYLRKDIRTLAPPLVKKLLEASGRNVVIVNKEALATSFSHTAHRIILIEDDVSRKLHTDLLGVTKATVSFESAFLRWDRQNSEVNSPITPDETIEMSSLSEKIVEALYSESTHSTDWWRHVAAGTFDNGAFITTHNTALPHEYITAIESDPRITEKRGVNIDKSLFIHAEALLIAQMAKKGIALEGKDIYVTTFPCANCARLIAMSGFTTCYFIEGYANLDGQRILKEMDVKVIKINAAPDSTPHHRLRPYPTKNK